MQSQDETKIEERRVIDAHVVATRRLTNDVVEFAIRPDEEPIQLFSPGAHILCEIELPDGSRDTRAYSLVNAPEQRDAYRIAVLREAEGRGGSRFMHALEDGAPLRIAFPRNDFPLQTDADEHVLIAGGIGVTPILAMAHALIAENLAHSVHYVGRDRAGMAYADEIEAMPLARILSDGGDPARGIDLGAALGKWSERRHAYVCGPRGLIEAVRVRAAALGWPDANVHFELFAAEAAREGDAGFTVELRQSGLSLNIAADGTILDAMIAAGLDPLYDCKRGECGLCTVPVLAGLPDHRDMNLSQREKDSGKVICTCVSRAKTPLLVLDA